MHSARRHDLLTFISQAPIFIALTSGVAAAGPQSTAKLGETTGHHSLNSATSWSTPKEIRPRQGGAGTNLVVVGNFTAIASAYEAEDVYLSSGAGSGFFGQATELGSSNVKGEILTVARYGQPQSIRVKAGNGAFLSVPTFGGISFPNPVWSWNSTQNEPETITSTPFSPLGEDLYSKCDGPIFHANQKAYLDGTGKMRIPLPGSKAFAGDEFSYWLDMYLDTGDQICAGAPEDQILGIGPWGLSSLWILLSLNTALNPHGMQASYDSIANEIVICPPPGRSIDAYHGDSYLRIDFDPASHVVVEEIGGFVDAFAPGLEPTTPDADFYSFAFVPGQGNRFYDENGCDDRIIETLSALGDPATQDEIRSICLETYLKASCGQTYTDGINLGWETGDTSYAWTTSLNNLPDAAGRWEVGEQSHLHFDLNELPVPFGTTRSILYKVLEAERLNLVIHDDTNVDYVKVSVVRGI